MKFSPALLSEPNNACLHSIIICKQPQARRIYLCCASASPLNQATQAAFKHIRRASGYDACSIYFSLNTKTILFTVHYLERDNMDTDTLDNPPISSVDSNIFPPAPPPSNLCLRDAKQSVKRVVWKSLLLASPTEIWRVRSQ